jgi:hypothetical protein
MTMKCVPEKNKKIFATRTEAEEFEKRNRSTFGNQQQYAYDCPHGDHVHLSSSPSSIVGAPQIKTTDWGNTKAGWKVVDPEISATRKDLILAALRRHNGSKTIREIAIECGLTNGRFGLVYSIARDHDLPYLMKRTYGRTTAPPVTLQSVQTQRERLEAELRRLGEQEQALRQQEEEKRRVTVKVASNGNNNSTTMIYATACGHALWLTAEQADSLLAQLPSVIEDMRSRQEAVSAVAGQ